jgi:hypothetical protein
VEIAQDCPKAQLAWARMQERLFPDEQPEPAFEEDYDPYEELREAARRLTREYVIDEEEAFQAILAFGSELGARRILRQRWWMGEVEMREEPEAA